MSLPVVLIADKLAESTVAALGDQVEVRWVDGPDREKLLAAIPEADALLVRSATTVDAEVLAAAPKLKIVARAGVGLDNVDVDAATAHGVLVVNAPTSNIHSAAEHALALLELAAVLQEAAKVDGATWWQRLTKVILPNMRAAIMVAVLFRALDAYRIFDNIFVMTKGAEGTQSISFLTYRQVIEQMQLGLGSAMSVLLFLSVLLLAWLIVKLFRVDLAQARGEG